ncbi:laglidadg homing endonuclease [Tuber brumale]|nr:laglidadg homing endonuclease [Tuber brumale]
MSQLAQEYNYNLIIFRYQTICIITISKLVGISEAISYNLTFSIISSIMNIKNNQTNLNLTKSNSYNNKNNKDLSFNHSCEITMDTRDAKALYEIKHKYGGTIKSVSNAYAVRYKLRHKKGLISLINDVNGLIRNPARLLQMNKLCLKYGIELKYPGPLNSDGSIYYSEASGQVFISVSQKNRYLLEPLIAIYSGRIDILSPKIEAFKYVIYRKAELFNLIDNYFTKYPLKTAKMKRVNLIKDFYLLRVDRNSQDINKFNE